MPELPEVERARRLLERVCGGRLVKLCNAVPDEKVFDGTTNLLFAEHLTGSRIAGAHRKGKQLWLSLDRRPFPLIHLGMTGSFAARLPDGSLESAEYVNTKVDHSTWPPKFWKFNLEMEDSAQVAFIAVRRFERVKLLQDPETEPPVCDLGFDPLLCMPPLSSFAPLLSRRAGPVKGALLDQAFSAGVGNWVADEVLYQARLHPETSCAALSEAQVASVWEKLGEVVRVACDADADSEKFPKDWLFHYRWTGKKASKTPDGHSISFITVASRTSAFVPALQKKTDGVSLPTPKTPSLKRNTTLAAKVKAEPQKLRPVSRTKTGPGAPVASSSAKATPKKGKGKGRRGKEEEVKREAEVKDEEGRDEGQEPGEGSGEVDDEKEEETTNSESASKGKAQGQKRTRAQRQTGTEEEPPEKRRAKRSKGASVTVTKEETVNGRPGKPGRGRAVSTVEMQTSGRRTRSVKEHVEGEGGGEGSGSRGRGKGGRGGGRGRGRRSLAGSAGEEEDVKGEARVGRKTSRR